MTFNATQTATRSHRNSNYLHRRKGSPNWYVRKRIPEDLQSDAAFENKMGIAKKELTQSTGKITMREAAVVADAILSQWERDFDALRGIGQPPIVDVDQVIPSPTSDLDFSFAGEQSLQVEQLFNKLIDLSTHKNLPMSEKKRLRQSTIDKKINKLSVAEVDALNKPMGDQDYKDIWIRFVQSQLDCLGQPAKVRQFAYMTSDLLDVEPGLSFSYVVKDYREKREKSGARSSVLRDIDVTTKMFAEKCLPNGLKTLQKDVTKQQANEFVEVARLRWPNLKTCSDKLSMMSTIFRHGVAFLDASETNPFEYAVKRLPKSTKGVRKNLSNIAYDTALLSKMLPSLARYYASSNSAPSVMVFPVALLALYTGMRIEEVCSLEKAHLTNIDGVDVIQIYDAKSQAGIREIPLNRGSKFVINWLIKRSTDKYLISGLPIFEGRRSKKVSDRFTVWKSEFFSQENHKRIYTFHSFRSTAITALDRANVETNSLSLLVGHEEGRDTLAKRVYSAGREIQSLVEPASKIDYGDELYKLAVKLLDNHQIIPA
jgi:integrase